MVGVFFNCFSQRAYVAAVTIELEIFQLGKVVDSINSLHGDKRPDNHLEHRSRSGIKGNAGDVAARDFRLLNSSSLKLSLLPL